MTRILSAYLTTVPTLHRGRFDQHTSLQKMVDVLLAQSRPGAMAGVRMAVVHDGHANRTRYRGVELVPTHVTSQQQMMQPQDERWGVYLRELHQSSDDECVFLIDLADVRVLNDPHPLCDAHPEGLFAGSDWCAAKEIKTWLRGRFLVDSHYGNRSAAGPLGAWFADRGRPVRNAGILGGRWRVLRPFLRDMVRATRSHYSSLEKLGLAMHGPVDMLVYNEQLLLALQSEVYSGWPWGYVNLPMSAQMCHGHNCSTARTASVPYWTCVRSAILEMQPRYYFAHKLACGLSHHGVILPCDWPVTPMKEVDRARAARRPQPSQG